MKMSRTDEFKMGLPSPSDGERINPSRRQMLRAAIAAPVLAALGGCTRKQTESAGRISGGVVRAGSATIPPSANSGKNEMSKVDICNWYVREGSNAGVELTLRRAESADAGSAMLVFSAAKGDAVEHDVERDRKAQPLSGIGDETTYSPYPVGNGGSIALRAGSSAVTITGSASKETLVAMAKLAVQRL